MFFSSNLRILLYTPVTDMRKSIDGLCYLVSEKLEENPSCGSIFVFCNRVRDKLKVLYWDGNGFCLLYKRLEKGRFQLPSNGQNLILNESDLRGLLAGINFQKIPKVKPLFCSVYC
jgi:transposase